MTVQPDPGPPPPVRGNAPQGVDQAGVLPGDPGNPDTPPSDPVQAPLVAPVDVVVPGP
jgi:hypothetical protein